MIDTMTYRRAIHFVFKIGKRNEAIGFYKNVLGMKILRHEEFEEGCKATCNGPYDGKWSKSMIGYGAEDRHFVLELTYNYGIGSYQLGNDFQYMTIVSSDVFRRVLESNWPHTDSENRLQVRSPDGYLFTVENSASSGNPLKKLTLSSSDLQQTKRFWHNLCGMQLNSEHDDSLSLAYDDGGIVLEFINIHCSVDHGSAFGRVALSCPAAELNGLQEKAINEGFTVLTPLLSLDTPGKATVQVVILTDPDRHEVCFVGDEAFRILSQEDPQADNLLTAAMVEDKSDKWFSKKGKSKTSA